MICGNMVVFDWKFGNKENYIMIVTICGSLKFQYHMMIVYNELSKRGNIVLLPVFDYDNSVIDKGRELHLKKIEMSNSICVVSCNDYVGDDTKREIEYAKNLGKEIIYFRNFLETAN